MFNDLAIIILCIKQMDADITAKWNSGLGLPYNAVSRAMPTRPEIYQAVVHSCL